MYLWIAIIDKVCIYFKKFKYDNYIESQIKSSVSHLLIWKHISLHLHTCQLLTLAQLLHRNIRSSPHLFYKKGILENFPKTLPTFFLNKVVSCRLATLSKRDIGAVDYPWRLHKNNITLKISFNQCFYPY